MDNVFAGIIKNHEFSDDHLDAVQVLQKMTDGINEACGDDITATLKTGGSNNFGDIWIIMLETPHIPGSIPFVVACIDNKLNSEILLALPMERHPLELASISCSNATQGPYYPVSGPRDLNLRLIHYMKRHFPFSYLLKTKQAGAVSEAKAEVKAEVV